VDSVLWMETERWMPLVELLRLFCSRSWICWTMRSMATDTQTDRQTDRLTTAVRRQLVAVLSLRVTSYLYATRLNWTAQWMLLLWSGSRLSSERHQGQSSPVTHPGLTPNTLLTPYMPITAVNLSVLHQYQMQRSCTALLNVHHITSSRSKHFCLCVYCLSVLSVLTDCHCHTHSDTHHANCAPATVSTDLSIT